MEAERFFFGAIKSSAGLKVRILWIGFHTFFNFVPRSEAAEVIFFMSVMPFMW
jgi:hypothetical protein